MVDVVLLAALALLVLGVIGSLTPILPGGVLSLTGIYLYWWAGNWQPGIVFLLGVTAIGLLAVIVDYGAGALAARAGGASWQTSLLAALVGLVLLVLTGPLGMLAGLIGTVFVLEFRDTRDFRGGLRAATYTTIGLLGSGVLQAVLTGSILVAFVLSVY
ncbi:MAG: DUF456 domain-containing protein [Halobacteriales archaeon]|nr:DUF456 domain-containing protein [Halobacteriales archaeon]